MWSRRRHQWKHFQWTGNVVWCISDEKHFHHFSNSYFELYFLHDFIKNSILLLCFVWCSRTDSHRIVNFAWKSMKFSTKLSKKCSSKYELEKWWKYFSSEMHQTTLPGHWKCFHWCLWRDHINACEKNQVFFMFVDYYRDSNSKCMHYIIALQKRLSFVRPRSRK